MKYPSKTDINCPAKRTIKYLNKHYPGFIEYLNQRYSFCESLNEQLYNYINTPQSTSRPCCKICGAPVNYFPSKGYTLYCGASCSANDPDKQAKITETVKERYGVENVSKSKICISKRKETLLEKYGDSNYNNQNKIQQTMLDKYGVTNAMFSEELKNKAVCTKSNHTEDQKLAIQQRYKNTCLERYGEEHYTNQNSRRKTMIDRYGVPVYNNLEKMIQTCLEKYGVERPAQSIEIKEKTKQTCLEKYGVEYACLRKETRANSNDSKPNINFMNLLQEHNIKFEREFVIDKYSYDFRIGNYLVEINPAPTHNSTWGIYGEPKRYDYHIKKSQTARQNGYTCIQIWDWDDVNKILGLIQPRQTIYGRNCKIKEVDKELCKNFLNENHLQGTCRGQSVRVGLYYNDELVGLMTFGRPRYNKHYDWELLRLSFKRGISIIGGSKKMFNYFLNHYEGSIISYCDLSKFSGNIYESLGFILNNTPFPSKHWYNIKHGDHITNNMLLQRGFDQLFGTNYGKGTSNEQLMIDRGFVEIYDCGQATYIYKKRNS